MLPLDTSPAIKEPLMPPKNTLDTSPAIIAAYLDERAGYMRRPGYAHRVAQVDIELAARGFDVSTLPQPEPDDDDGEDPTPAPAKGKGGRKAKAKDDGTDNPPPDPNAQPPAQ